MQEAAASLFAQTIWPIPWLIRMDEPDRFGSAHLAMQLNTLLQSVETEFVAILDDDDLFDPNYLEEMAKHLDGADIIYSFCRARGHIQRDWDPTSSPRLLRTENWIDGESVLRVSKIREVGGWPVQDVAQDWMLWQKMLDANAVFRCVPQELRDHRRGPWGTITP